MFYSDWHVAQVADVLAKHLAPEVLREAVLTLVHCAEGSGAAQVRIPADPFQRCDVQSSADEMVCHHLQRG